MVTLAASLVIIGGLAQLYVIVIGGQAYPLVLFPGMEVSSSFFDGVTAGYVPSIFEILLGFGGICLSLVIVTIGIAVLEFLPESLSDQALKLDSVNPSST